MIDIFKIHAIYRKYLYVLDLNFSNLYTLTKTIKNKIQYIKEISIWSVDLNFNALIRVHRSTAFISGLIYCYSFKTL